MDWGPVTSSVHQELMLGLRLFVIYINIFEKNVRLVSLQMVPKWVML